MQHDAAPCIPAPHGAEAAIAPPRRRAGAGIMPGMTTAVENAYRDLSPLEVRLRTHRLYSEAEQDGHMLSHADDPAEAVAEARRVLRPGGRFAAAVNIEQSYPHMTALRREVTARHGITLPPTPTERVHSGNLPGLVAHGFAPDTISVLRRDNALVF